MLNLSPINQKYIENQKTKQTEKPVQQIPTEKKPDKKALFCSVAAAIGVIALASTLIYKKIKSGKTDNLSDDGKKAFKIVRQFLNKDNQIIEGVTLQNGKAINADNTLFSGIMNTVNKKGEKISIEYQDGFIISSSKNNKIFKKFENITNLTREQGVLITKLDDKGIKDAQILVTTYDNGKAKRIFTNPKPSRNHDEIITMTATEISPNGKIAAKAEYDQNNCLQMAQIFDENGNLRREIGLKHKFEKTKYFDDKYLEKIFDENGNLRIIKKAKGNYYPAESVDDIRTWMLSEHYIHQPETIEFYSPNRMRERVISVKSEANSSKINIFEEGDNYSLRETINAKKDNSYSLNIVGQNMPLFKWDINSGSICLSSKTRDEASKKTLKQYIAKTADKLEEAYNIIEKEKMPYEPLKDGEYTHIDIPSIIKQMRSFLEL